MFLLDTDTCIHLLNGSSARARQELLGRSSSAVKLCSVVKAELVYGARHSARVDENLQLLERFFQPMESLAFDDVSAEFYAMIREDLTCQGRLIGPHDLMIAAIARQHDLTLVSHNVGEFNRVPGLRLVDWLE